MTFDEMLADLIHILKPFGARPDVPLEAEEYFSKLVECFDDREACIRHLTNQAPKLFRSLREKPDWIQDPRLALVQG